MATAPPTPDPIDEWLADFAAGDASDSDAAVVRALADSDAGVAARLAAAERVERLLRIDTLFAVPLGLVSGTLARLAAERDPRREHGPARRLMIAASALIALGTGIGGLWTATTGDGFGVFARLDQESREGRGTAAVVDLAVAARASTSASVGSLAAVPDQVPGSPAALGAGALVLLGAAAVGSRRQAYGGRVGTDGVRT